MSRRKPTNDERSRRHADATSRAMKRSARQRTCPACGRGAALGRKESADGVVVVFRCRYCGHERGFDLSDALFGR